MAADPRAFLRLGGRGSWRRPKPVVAEVVPGSRPYLWLGVGDDYVAALTPAEALRLAAYITRHFGEANGGR